MYVELKDINKTYAGYQASNHVSFGIEQGRLIALLGPSGSGKTTILRMIAGLETPDSGEIVIDGKVVNNIPASERGIGFVFQNYALFRYMTVYDNIAFGLNVKKENKKYIYGQVREGSRAKDFELAIQWLLDCGLIHKVQRIQKPDLPLKAYIDFDAFKLFLVDIGLLIAMTDLDAKVIIEGNKIFTEFKGSLTEQYILQQLISDVGVIPYYYSTQNSKGEIDFLVQGKTSVIPIEVKAEENLKAKSLKAFCEKYQPSYAVRTSMSDYREQDWMTNIPLYAIKWIENYVNQ